MGRAIEEPVGIRGEVWAVLEHTDRYFDGEPHAKDCPWWKEMRAKNCACGRYEIHYGENIISNAGDTHYAEGYTKGKTGTPSSFTTNFDTMTVATAVTTAFGTKTADCGDITTVPTSGTKTITSGYPKISDPDTNNPSYPTDSDIVTWKASYTTSEGNGTIVGVAIHLAGATLGSGSAPVLMSIDLSPTVTKTSGITLSWYVNHQFNGT